MASEKERAAAEYLEPNKDWQLARLRDELRWQSRNSSQLQKELSSTEEKLFHLFEARAKEREVQQVKFNQMLAEKTGLERRVTELEQQLRDTRGEAAEVMGPTGKVEPNP
jgi:hypothetical protein